MDKSMDLSKFIQLKLQETLKNEGIYSYIKLKSSLDDAKDIYETLKILKVEIR